MSHHQEPMEILIVDDDPEDVELLVDALREEGIKNPVRVDHDADRVLEELLSTDTDRGVVLLDLHMPRMSGFELLEHLEQRRRDGRSLPRILVLTSSSHPEDRARAFALGAEGYLEKPVDSHGLRAIERTVEGRDAPPTTTG